MSSEGRRNRDGSPDMTDPAWHEDDSYGGCVACMWSVPYTEDEYERAPYPCAVVREATARLLERERIYALPAAERWREKYGFDAESDGGGGAP